MKYFVVLLLVASVVATTLAQEDEDESNKDSWWKGFKERVKKVLSKWREDIKSLWDEVLAKTDDIKGWTTEMFDSLKRKLKEFVEKKAEIPDDEKNEIETFISKLKVPTEPPKQIDP